MRTISKFIFFWYILYTSFVHKTLSPTSSRRYDELCKEVNLFYQASSRLAYFVKILHLEANQADYLVVVV